MSTRRPETGPHPVPRQRRVRAPRAAAILAALGVIALPAAAGASIAKTSPPSPQVRQIQQLQAKRDQVRAQKASSASKVNALQASDSQIQQALGALQDNVSASTSQLEDAQRAVDAADADRVAAEAAEAKAESELGSLRTTIRQQAVAAYVNPPSDDQWTILSSGSATNAAAKKTLLEVQANHSLDAIEQYRSVQEDLTTAHTKAVDAKARAEQHQKEVQGHLNDLQQAEAQQQKFSDDVATRIANEQAEADGLATIDSALSQQISSQQATLAAQLAAQQRSAAAARAALTKAGRTVAPGGGSATIVHTGPVNIVTVNGIQVDQSIAGPLGSLLAAAAADGITMSGGGYRSSASQVALRQAHCGSSNYAIYQAPASSCSPPTAVPGQSMHERGLAVDFTYNGSTLTRGSAAFGWMKAHAASYGFYNLPSEPWHWSTNGN